MVVATGTRAAEPPIDGLADVDHWTNREAIETEVVPGSLAVLGGGAIGLELAQMFARFGAAVTVVEALPRLLPGEEPEAGALLAEVLAGEGLTLHTAAKATAVRAVDGRVEVDLDGGASVRAERLLVATGRRADLDRIGATSIGVAPDARFLPVDERLRVADGVWAIGDVTGKGLFTHVAMYQARIAVADILGREVAPAEYDALPRVTFTDPEVGSVGLSEEDARDAGVAVQTGWTRVPSTARGWLHKAGNEGFIKLVADAEREVLVGATSVGPVGGEVLGLLTLAVHAAVPLARMRDMIYAYPTFHRGVEDALRDLGP